jgi:hypothetical protein
MEGLNNYNSLNFSQIPNSNGQVWTLAIFGDELICGHNDGTFKLVNGRLEKISQITGGWIFKLFLEQKIFFKETIRAYRNLASMVYTFSSSSNSRALKNRFDF